ncbi:nucleoside/nucleotide kinase family protein [Nocardioides cynanchi]|uniref:nucleoside/nucleotide kinase family protein n=1 Tax=Nocardioides cynanchi TaxID=2558918 RepID=UPI001EE1BBA6|nr:nucleoside/nucleotide kinase family protein [Nocardioides cynanchi]
MGRTDRRIIGIAGAPGAGKSTYAERLVAQSEVPAAQVPMDGFHLADSALVALGLRDRKGAPETFDAWGYAALLRRLRSATGTAGETVWAPAFSRDLEQPLAGAIGVRPDVELVVTEGNYLLLDRPEWRAVRAELDEVWFLDLADDVRRARLVARHVEFGKSPDAARCWVSDVDDPNAVLVAASRDRADRFVTL